MEKKRKIQKKLNLAAEQVDNLQHKIYKLDKEKCELTEKNEVKKLSFKLLELIFIFRSY